MLAILFLCAGDFELPGRFPLLDVDRVVPRATSAIINDALAGEGNDWDEKDDEPKASVVGCQFDCTITVRAGPRSLGYVLLAEVASADSIVSDGHNCDLLPAD